MAKVKAYVYVLVGGVNTLLRPGDDVPEGVSVTNPDVLEADAKILPAPEKEQEEAPAPAEPTPAKKAPARKAATS